MIADVERYQGIVFRQLIAAAAKPLTLGVVNVAGRMDAFSVDGAAFQIKYSTKRMSPWQFTYIEDNLNELETLKNNYSPVWAVLVCGIDGIVCLTSDELQSIVGPGPASASIRVSRSKNSMYRVSGSRGELPRAKARGVTSIVAAVQPAELQAAGQ